MKKKIFRERYYGNVMKKEVLETIQDKAKLIVATKKASNPRRAKKVEK